MALSRATAHGLLAIMPLIIIATFLVSFSSYFSVLAFHGGEDEGTTSPMVDPTSKSGGAATHTSKQSRVKVGGHY